LILGLAQAKDAYRRQRFRRTYFSPRRLGSSRLWLLNNVPQHIKLYYEYCAAGVARQLRAHPSHRDVYLCFAKHVTSLPGDAWTIVLQVEQTVLAPTHPQDEAVESTLPFENTNQHYLARLLGPRQGYAAASRIIEYSKANIEHIQHSIINFLYEDKAFYIAPLLGKETNRVEPMSPVSVKTMFGSPHLGRRRELIRELKKSDLEVSNIHNYDDYRGAFENCSVLVNYRQFSHFRTVEELRILPALLQRVIVVSESGPYLDHIPYRRFARFADSDEFVKEVLQAVGSYESTWEELFGQYSEFSDLIQQLRLDNETNFRLLVS